MPCFIPIDETVNVSIRTEHFRSYLVNYIEALSRGSDNNFSTNKKLDVNDGDIQVRVEVEAINSTASATICREFFPRDHEFFFHS